VAVLSVKEVWDDRTGQADGRLKRAYARSFRVVTDNSLDGPMEVETAVPIAIWDSYVGPLGVPSGEFDIGAICNKISSRQDQDDPNVWMVTCNYETDPREFDPQRAQQKGNPQSSSDNSPMAKPPDISFTTVKFKKPIAQDLYGAPLLNSAGSPFDPPAEIDDSRMCLTITRYETSFNQDWLLVYQDAVNSDIFFGQDPGRWKCDKIDAHLIYESGVLCWKVTYVFMLRIEGWILKVLDAGMNCLAPDPADATGKTQYVTPCTDKKGQAVSHPVCLDGGGHQLAANGTPVVLSGRLVNQSVQPNPPQTIITGIDTTKIPTVPAGSTSQVWVTPTDLTLAGVSLSPPQATVVAIIDAQNVQISAGPIELANNVLTDTSSFTFQLRSQEVYLYFRAYRTQRFADLKLPGNYR
jgi:hypothetical protein